MKKLLARIFLSIISVILTILLLLAAALAYCAFDRKSALSSIPRNYSLYIHTDSAFDTVNPLFDLQAADLFLSSPEYSSLRKPFMDFRSSDLRDNGFVKFAASRQVDFAVYGDGSKIGSDSHFVAVLNLGIFSLASRVGSYMYPKLSLSDSQNEFLKNLSYETNEQTSYFVYKTPDLTLYLKSVKNLLIASDSFEHLLTASLVENDTTYTPAQKKLFRSGKKGELRIVADASSLMHSVTGGNPILSSMSNLIASDSLSVVSFNITDSDLSLKCRLPVTSESEDAAPLAPILAKKSSVPSIITRFSDITQYYTVLNAGTLEELKDAVLPFIPDVKNPDEYWKNCDDWCKTLLSMDLNEFLFSWMGDEFAVFGIENQNDPVFAIQIKDEKARQSVFNKLLSSILIKDDNSLILGGVRLSKLEFPSFLNWMLGIVGVNMPSPYFMVLDGTIYFSESAECLSAVYTNAHSGKSLIKSKTYSEVSKDLKNDTSISLFYNLERSVPFFLRSNEALSQVLKLYTMGRFDVRIEKDVLEINLHACARKSGSLYSVPGFPLSLEQKASPLNLQVDSGKNPKHLYWVEGQTSLKALDLSSMQIASKEDSDKIEIVASSKPKNGGTVWSVSSHGVVSLLNPALEAVGRFPLMLGENISCRPCSSGENLVLVSDLGTVFIVKPDASLVTIEIPGLSAKSEPVALSDGRAFAIYSKGFLGKIYYFEGEKCVNLENPFEIPGIALGSPAILKNSSKIYVGIITQAGELNIWRADSKDGEQIDGFPLRLGGVFMTNLVASEKYFYALSSDALLYRISLDGSILTVQIPNSSARHGFICLRDTENNGRESLFVCADANVIYGFNENLELLSGYPLAGWGKPVFADVNGDKVSECLALTIDKKLTAWRTR
ncbi:hypothetical protein DYE50_08775 [Treponema ruminis]|uniref:Uncharacterized protein n=1 Tax=Treponema ruminis TaxID=744515 RepID=A0A7W8G9V5_9SPIR|nr:hypothetical protein [Treponema ruminis]MBB5226435.1 hypothetical protein [Treponema ruminis]QSI02660.1 hypothetical protein DYE50_08775 [Treponema ruminis]